MMKITSVETIPFSIPFPIARGWYGCADLGELAPDRFKTTIAVQGL